MAFNSLAIAPLSPSATSPVPSPPLPSPSLHARTHVRICVKHTSSKSATTTRRFGAHERAADLAEATAHITIHTHTPTLGHFVSSLACNGPTGFGGRSPCRCCALWMRSSLTTARTPLFQDCRQSPDRCLAIIHERKTGLVWFPCMPCYTLHGSD